MAGYTLKLDLTEYERGVLLTLLKNEAERADRDGTTDSPWNAAIAKISDEIVGYREAIDTAKNLSYPDGSKNNLPADHPDRAHMVTLDAAPNVYLTYPAYGQLVIHEFDIHGEPLLLGFRAYRTNGTVGPNVSLGHVRECTWRTGWHDGATIRRV